MLAAFFLAFGVIFIAELGDKSQLMALAFATRFPPFKILLGITLGMVAADGLAIAVGRVLGKRLPERVVKIGAAAAFFIFGALLIAEGVRG